MNVRTIVSAYLLLQATCTAAWWCWLLRYPETVALFHPAAWPRDALFAFMLPDCLGLIVGSAATAWLIARDSTASKLAIWALSAGIGYPTLYCISASIQSGQAWLGAGLMSCMFGLTLAMATIVGVEGQSPAAFRPTSMSKRWSIAFTFVQVVIFWTIFLVVLPRAIVEVERLVGLPQSKSEPFAVVAVVLFVACSCLGLWSAWTMATLGLGTPLPTAAAVKLVSTGPYRLVRNPMASAGIGQGFAMGIWLGSPSVVVYSLAGILVWHFIVRPFEESDLVDRFGADYEAYRRSVGLWLPHNLIAAKVRDFGRGLGLPERRGFNFRRR
ncbi:MAG: isoprenylcysteine carboxylmethyltransferase family protein [Planctomycetales bacterium]|nr:isoprenylcysteine carboxylmethyltransferase family protein [Planctomycetales bacterium]